MNTMIAKNEGALMREKGVHIVNRAVYSQAVKRTLQGYIQVCKHTAAKAIRNFQTSCKLPES